VKELLKFAREAGYRRSIDSLQCRRDLLELAQMPQKLPTSGPIASSRLAPPATGCQESSQPALIKPCQWQTAPLEPATESL
jgi:hypothetical protein